MKNPIKLIRVIEIGIIFLLVFCTEAVEATVLPERQLENSVNMQDDAIKPISRGEFVVNLMKLFEEEIGPYGEGSYVFIDAGMNTVYGYYIQAAFYSGVINGMGEDNSYFKPNDSLTREQAAVILGQFIGQVEMEYMKKTIIFRDETVIPPWAKTNIRIVSEAGIMVGDTEGFFNPKDVVTHEMGDTLLIRLKDRYDTFKVGKE